MYAYKRLRSRVLLGSGQRRCATASRDRELLYDLELRYALTPHAGTAQKLGQHAELQAVSRYEKDALD